MQKLENFLQYENPYQSPGEYEVDYQMLNKKNALIDDALALGLLMDFVGLLAVNIYVHLPEPYRELIINNLKNLF